LTVFIVSGCFRYLSSILYVTQLSFFQHFRSFQICFYRVDPSAPAMQRKKFNG
jgi:hypothetical protein